VKRLAILCAALLPALASAGTARFGVVAGNNVGSLGRPRLWFAEKDMERFDRALHELGEFPVPDVIELREARPGDVRQAFETIEPRIRAARERGDRTLLVFYYSGHAGPSGLELGNDKLPFDELRAMVQGSAADTKVAIVDACEAGLLTQVKGATATASLDFALPADDAVKGVAFIASTAVGEAAQESAAIGGSFFTHHLEAGLRGAADADGDEQVTLAEAFRYTAARTVSGTASTQVGAQHPTYDFKMSGRGEVVLADLRKAESKLRVPVDPRAQYYLRGPRGVFTEFPGAAVDLLLALPAGRYQVERRGPDGRSTAEVVLERGATQVLPEMTPTRYEIARSKGGPKPGLIYTGLGAGYMGLPGFGVAPSMRIGARKELGPVGLRLRLDYMLNNSVDDAGLRYDFTYQGGALAAYLPVNTGKVLIEAGPELGYGYAIQKLEDSRQFSSGVFGAGVALMAPAPVGPVRVGLDVSVGAQAFKLNEQNTVRPAGSAALLALYDF
jgi:hypothetical protein